MSDLLMSDKTKKIDNFQKLYIHIINIYTHLFLLLFPLGRSRSSKSGGYFRTTFSIPY